MADHIVLVDDDSFNLKIAKRILEKEEMQVTALNSGAELLEFMKENRPELILLDILMPGMDGFETLERLRAYESENGLKETPVVFLTAEGDLRVETKGFEKGVVDFIRKPFNADVLLKRIGNVLKREEEIHKYREEAVTDHLTGLLNKGALTEKLSMLLKCRAGYLLMIDLDSFKLINDIYGHDAGDKILSVFSDLLKKHLGENDIIGRNGGDEFTVFATSYESENQVKKLSVNLNAEIFSAARKLFGESMEIPIGVSVGAVYSTGHGSDYAEMLKKADKALLKVKESGKHGYMLYGEENFDETDNISLKNLSMILSERNIPNSALKLEKNSFITVYRFVMRYILRYHKDACKILFTLSCPEPEPGEKFDELCEAFGNHIGGMLRKSDLMMQYRKNQYFVFLTDIREDAIKQVVGNIIRTWRAKNNDNLVISYETDYLKNERPEVSDDRLWVVVVDDDALNRKLAEHVLVKNDIRTTLLSSGIELLEFLNDKRPDLILLDVNMPEMDGFETLENLRTSDSEIAEIPVVFLTGENDRDAEKKGLSLGAMDFIRKPFVPEVLTLRVRQIVELLRLQRHLSDEVGKKARENEQLFLNVVSSLAGAIDAKDTYTNGHSSRVAEYSKEIAKRYGYNMKEQSDIYIMALLHDVGKIGVPDAVINKPGRLNDEEFELIKKHPVVGSRILSNIREMPKLSVGARWHHERYDGKGYPDGLVGEEIPEEARIIAVADAYDAMTSNRSYRRVMTQEMVRSEIKAGKGTQFDPRFADIMLSIIEEDKDYTLREC